MKNTVALVSPGLLPVPPVLGGSVETVMQRMAEVTKRKYHIDIYGPDHPSLPAVEKGDRIDYYRYPTGDYRQYFNLVRAHVHRKNYPLIQVENRPLFILRTKLSNPKTRFICSLHSLDHIAEKLIKPAKTLEIFRKSDRVLVYSKFMQERLRLMFPEVADRVCFIHLGTELEKFRPRWDPAIKEELAALRSRLNIPEDYRVVFFAGRVIPKKGAHVLIAALEQVIRAYPHCCLVVAGSGWFGSKRGSPYINRLHRQAEQLAGHIRFTNYVHPAEMPLYFALADVFVCPSQWDEPFGLVNTEAMAAGTPVVASARGGIPEIVEDGVNGFLVADETDPQAFVKPLLQLLNNPDLAKAFGARGRQKVEEYFNWERAGRELTQLYDHLLR